MVATGRRKDRLAELEREILSAEGRCAVLAGDIADLTLGDKLTELAQKQTGRLDILVYSAGMALRTPTLEMKPEEWDEVFRVNVTAAMFLAQKSIPLMRRQGSGRMVFISSTASKNVNLGASPSYGASKAAMDGVVRHLAAEFARDQILVNAICPGPQGKGTVFSASGQNGNAGTDSQSCSFSGIGAIGLYQRGNHSDEWRQIYGMIFLYKTQRRKRKDPAL